MVIGGTTMQEYKKRMVLLFTLLAFDVVIFVLAYLLVAEVLMLAKINSFIYFILGAIFACSLMYGTLKKLK